MARALREWHEATSGFDLTGSVWNLEAPEPHQVVCHNDFAPYNCVFCAGRFVGALDFDHCSPGPRLWDIAYTAYRFVPLMPPLEAPASAGAGERSPFDLVEALARLDVFLGAYAATDARFHYSRGAVLGSAIERLRALASWTAAHARSTGVSTLADQSDMYAAHASWLFTRFRAELGT